MTFSSFLRVLELSVIQPILQTIYRLFHSIRFSKYQAERQGAGSVGDTEMNQPSLPLALRMLNQAYMALVYECSFCPWCGNDISLMGQSHQPDCEWLEIDAYIIEHLSEIEATISTEQSGT